VKILFHFRYPCLQTARILLQCGADVNAFDARKNTPLHIFTSNVSNCDESTVKLLCEGGAHLDYVNARGETPLDLATSPIIKQILKSQMQIKLKCLCARLIRKNDVPFHGNVSTSLVNFVEKH
jgi:Fem-1 family protein b